VVRSNLILGAYGTVIRGTVMGGTVIGGNVVAGKVIEGTVIGGTVISGTVIGGTEIGGTEIGGTVIAGTVIAGIVGSVTVRSAGNVNTVSISPAPESTDVPSTAGVGTPADDPGGSSTSAIPPAVGPVDVVTVLEGVPSVGALSATA
jgi:hypothetical protein